MSHIRWGCVMGDIFILVDSYQNVGGVKRWRYNFDKSVNNDWRTTNRRMGRFLYFKIMNK